MFQCGSSKQLSLNSKAFNMKRQRIASRIIEKISWTSSGCTYMMHIYDAHIWCTYMMHISGSPDAPGCASRSWLQTFECRHRLWLEAGRHSLEHTPLRPGSEWKDAQKGTVTLFYHHLLPSFTIFYLDILWYSMMCYDILWYVRSLKCTDMHSIYVHARVMSSHSLWFHSHPD